MCGTGATLIKVFNPVQLGNVSIGKLQGLLQSFKKLVSLLYWLNGSWYYTEADICIPS